MLFQTERYIAWNSSDKLAQFVSLSKIFSAIFTSIQYKSIILLSFTLLFLFSRTATANDGVLKLTTGAEYTSGNYSGTEPIDEWYVPLTAKFIVDRYVFRLTVPYIHVTAPVGTVLVDGTILPGTGVRNTESGPGDIIAGISYRDALNSEASSDLALDFTAKVKFGTADENKGLGTGENDYTLQAELYKYLDRFMTFGILGYKLRGDPPGVNLNDSWLALVGGNYRFSRSLSGGVDFYFQQASLSQADDQMELSAFVGYRLSHTQFLRGYLIQGFGDGSPDWGAGVLITFVQ